MCSSPSLSPVNISLHRDEPEGTNHEMGKYSFSMGLLYNLEGQQQEGPCC